MKNGQVFTPESMVIKMLDSIGFVGEGIVGKTILEPSFGDGAFLVEIVNRILKEVQNLSLEEKKQALDNVYGIEIDKSLCDKTITRLDELVKKYGIFDYDWKNLVCADALFYETDRMFDYIVGNPPYIRVHDLNKKTRDRLKEFGLSKGNLDLYVVFFELCIYLLNGEGKLCFITPNSYFINNSQKEFRNYLIKTNILREIWDYKSVKVFNADTYTVVTLLDRGKGISNRDLYYHYMTDIGTEEYTSKFDINIWYDNLWYFSTEENVEFLFNVLNKHNKLSKLCDIHFGIETNANSVYVLNQEDIDKHKLEKDLLRPVVKASTLEDKEFIIFPYKFIDSGYEVIEEDELKVTSPNIYAYFLQHKKELLARDMDKGAKCWYQYARCQGIQKSKNKKIALKQYIASDTKKCEILDCDENTLVYSGIYIVVKDNAKYEFVKSVLLSSDFCRYLLLVGKDIAGGYKNINSKMVKNYGYK